MSAESVNSPQLSSKSWLQVDLVPEEAQLQLIEQELLSINSDVAILRCVRSFIDLGQILNVGAYTMTADGLPSSKSLGAWPSRCATSVGTAIPGSEQLLQQGRASEKQPAAAPPELQLQRPAGVAAEHHSGHSHPAHSREIGTVSFRLPGHLERQRWVHSPWLKGEALCLLSYTPFDDCRFTDWLDKLLWEGSEATQSMYRIKGLLSFSALQPPCILQAVHELYDLTPAACDPVTESKIVFIGRQLDREALHAGLLLCINSALPLRV